MMKNSLLILLTVVVLFAGYRIFVAPPQVKEGSIPYNTIICFGDSLTFGTGAEAGMDYPSQLSQMIAKPVINAGVPGDTTARALKRLQRDVLARSPDLVLITLGGNDLKNGIAKDTAFNNLEHIVESIQGQGARVIIGGLKYITSGGDSGNVTGAKNTILYAVIGLIIVVLAQVIVRFVLVQTNDLAA